jgi:predicted dehydrogenase
MKSLVEQGVIGSVHEARFEYSGDYGLNGPPGWRGTISKGGIGGILQDLGSHLIDLGKYILNDNIDKVQGFLSFYENGKLKSYHEKSTKDQAADSVSFLAQFSNGIRATFSTSWIANQGNKKQTIDIQLYGTKGSIKLVTCELGTSLRYANKGENWHAVKVEGLYQLNLESEPHEYKFRPWRLTKTNEVWKWIDHIRNRKTNELATFYDGLSVQKVIDAVIESAKQERLIDIK